MKRHFWLIGLVVAAVWVGCDSGPKSGRGFRLPEGNPVKGQAAFVSLQCHTCHSVAGVELPAPPSTGSVQFALGGEVTRLRSYGDLVTSIINPSHGVSPGFDMTRMEGEKLSPMPEFNQVMTVEQMIDLVAFLHAHYTKLDPGPYYYMP